MYEACIYEPNCDPGGYIEYGKGKTKDTAIENAIERFTELHPNCGYAIYEVIKLG